MKFSKGTFLNLLTVATALLFLSGCATLPRQTEEILKNPGPIPESFQISSVPFIPQTQNFCGPASLAMVLNWAGRKPQIEELGAQMYTPGKEGTLQTDLLGAGRRHGMLTIPVKGMKNLLTEVAHGHPVIVLQNLAFSWYPKWHYAVTVGYNLKNRELILHSGPEAFKRVDLGKFEKSWEHSDYWGLAVLPPSVLAATGDELSHAGAAAILEQIGKLNEAEQIYTNMMKKWPQGLSALIGMGNIRFSQKKFLASVAFLEKAARLHAHSPVVWHNLAIAQGKAGMSDKARKSASRALTLQKEVKTRELYRQGLREWL